ncbi:unnamed protein product [Triticum turgidum subsp. durum]|uniref:MADS-box domain-containing protein n=1 Tax=Triticum turgidum subsp. durum TaxID=4567 RepID=A0A9R1QU56_TRITD|nr:unnamed protein product [Triticum turgidum subsp. durum]
MARLIETDRKRRLAFTTRRRGLLDKARQLAVLCGVAVTVVCTDPEGGALTVMETEEGVPALMDNERKRGLAFRNRRRGLLEKAEQLAALCGAQVAVVCADPWGGAPTVMETEAGVLARAY